MTVFVLESVYFC